MLGRVPFTILSSLCAFSLMLAFNVPLLSQAPESGARVGLPTGLPPSMLKGGVTGELLSLYSPRNTNDIQDLLDNAKSVLKAAANTRAEGESRAQAANGQLQIMQGEQQTTKTRLNVAKNEKNTSDVILLTNEAKRQEAEKKYLVSLRNTMNADMALLDSQRIAVEAQVKMLQIELDTAKKHDVLAGGSLENKAANADYAAQLKMLFNAQKDFADRATEAASKQQSLASRKLKQLDVWSKLSK